MFYFYGLAERKRWSVASGLRHMATRKEGTGFFKSHYTPGNFSYHFLTKRWQLSHLVSCVETLHPFSVKSVIIPLEWRFEGPFEIPKWRLRIPFSIWNLYAFSFVKRSRFTNSNSFFFTSYLLPVYRTQRLHVFKMNFWVSDVLFHFWRFGNLSSSTFYIKFLKNLQHFIGVSWGPAISSPPH